MAVCLFDTIDQAILRWEVVDISPSKVGDISQISARLISYLDDLVLGPLADIPAFSVLIENQPVMKAPTMKSIQMVIYTYFKVMDVHGDKAVDLCFVSAARKNTYMKSKGYDVKAKTYKSNKDNSVAFVQEYLIAKGDTTHQGVLSAHKKKDDLCDSLIQIFSHYNY